MLDVYNLHMSHKIKLSPENIRLGMAKGNFEFTIVMYHPDNGQRSYKPQTKHTERMILPRSSQNTHDCTFEYVGAEKQTAEKSVFVI